MALNDLGLGQLLRAVLIRALLLLSVTTAGYYLAKGFTIRRRFQRMQREGIPMMPHSAIWGHLPIIGKLTADLPSDFHGDYLQLLIQKNWKELFPNCKSCPPVFIIDTWPITTPIMLSVHPAMTSQFTQEVSRVKPKEQKRFMYPLTHNLDLTSMEGADWKLWRKRLSPGFSLSSIISRVPDLVEEVEVFADTLRKKAGKDGAWGEVFPLETIGKDVTMDVIGRFILNTRVHAQTNPHVPLKTALQDTIPRMIFYLNILNFLSHINPYNQLCLWLNNRTMNTLLLPLVHARIASTLSKSTNPAEKNHFLSLTVRSLQQEGAVPDATFMATVLGQIKIILFAGHDTTASTICWITHTLYRNPEALSRLRSEHDTILGSTKDTASTLKSNPHLVNSLVYTAAVIKETLRLHTNVGTMRAGGKGFTLFGPIATPEFAGIAFPTEGCVLWDGSWAQHRDPNLWHRVDEFLPERWLVTDPTDPLYPSRNGFRAFELGPRDCIGQSLSVVEMKLILALVVREFEIGEDWEGWDLVKGRKDGKKDIVFGERAYQCGPNGMPGIKDGLPVRVRVREEVLG